MNVLVYARPWNKEQFCDLASKVWPDHRLVVSSEHPSVDESDLYRQFYENMRVSIPQKQTNLTVEQIDDVIDRCRLLRAINRQLALKLLHAMELAVESVLEKTVAKYMLSITVDSYVLHLFSLLCKKRNIVFIGLIPTFVNGYFRVTSVGERVFSRTVSDEECETILNQLQDNSYKPSFLASNKSAQKAKSIKLWARNIPKPLWFVCKRLFSGDVYNYHYFSTQIVSSIYWSFLPKKYEGLEFLSSGGSQRNPSSKPMVFIPLQMSPEATVDYWSLDTSWCEYETKVLSLIESLSVNYNVVVKEHPNIVGFRTKSFYRSLTSLRNNEKCLLLDVSVNSNAVLDCCDAVVLCTGSVGFEAAIRGVPVYSDAAPFYMPSNMLHPIKNLLEGRLEKRQELTKDKKYQLMRYLLEGIISGSFVNDGSWNRDMHNQDIVAKNIASHLCI